MPDSRTLEDQAALYVLGRLTPIERCEFEVSLSESAELRALVRELEEGAVVLAMGVPQRKPPQYLWQRIENAVAEEARRKIVAPSFWVSWWRSGWAAAAACLVGWLLYALWIKSANQPDVSSSQVATDDHPQPGITDSVKLNTGNPALSLSSMSIAGTRSPQTTSTTAQAKEIRALHGQIAQLQGEVTQLSQMLTQQQALLADAGRLKFFQLVRASGSVASATTATPSSDLQRALLLALARELGWQSADSTQANPARTNQTGIDFVDLHPGADAPENPPTVEPGSTDTLESSLVATSTTGIPAFVLGDKAYLAFDSSVLMNGSSLTFFTGTASQGFQTLGTAVFGNNPLVVTIPLANTTHDGLNLTVTAGTPSGTVNTFVPLQTPVSTPP
jgi:hypothetical protein